MKFIPATEVDSELHAAASEKPPKYALQTLFPLNDLDDRAFELLLYSLAKQHAHIFPFAYDSYGLSLPGGDKGRDIALFHENHLCAVVQCQRQNALIDRS